MKLSISLVALAFACSVSAVPISHKKRDVPVNLIPEFGHQSNVNPTGTGDCDGAVNGPNGSPIKIPCSCPPDRQEFIRQLNANVAAGHAVKNPSVQVSFPLGDSKEDKLGRITAATITLQNLNGPGVGCPNVATTFGAQAQAIRDGRDAPAPPAPAPAPAPPPPPPPAAPASPPAGGDQVSQIRALAPDFGHQSNINPTGTGDCDGAVNGPDGKPIKIPCSCPPDRAEFLRQLVDNVQAGRAIKNPSVQVNFPLGNSKEDKLGRITAATITLQNLNGPGVGCPNVATTFGAQAQAIRDGRDAPPAPAPAPAPPPSAPASAPAPPAGGNREAQIRQLAPEFGHQSNVNPTGTGDCDGAVNGPDGKPIKIPCSCPPPREEFLNQLVANVNAGQAVKNPAVKVSFPTGNSKQDQLARFHAATVTLQNLNGPGVGCPNVATTFGAQVKAIEALPN